MMWRYVFLSECEIWYMKALTHMWGLDVMHWLICEAFMWCVMWGLDVMHWLICEASMRCTDSYVRPSCDASCEGLMWCDLTIDMWPTTYLHVTHDLFTCRDTTHTYMWHTHIHMWDVTHMEESCHDLNDSYVHSWHDFEWVMSRTCRDMTHPYV